MTQFTKAVLVTTIVAVGLALTMCDRRHRISSEPVRGTVVRKYAYRPGKGPRQYCVVVRYQDIENCIKDRGAYTKKAVGEPYDACLTTYENQHGEQSKALTHCPAP